MQQLFEAMDANHDGVLSRKEFEQAPMESQGSWNHRDDIKLGRYTHNKNTFNQEGFN